MVHEKEAIQDEVYESYRLSEDIPTAIKGKERLPGLALANEATIACSG